MKMTFVKIYTKENETTAIREYALLRRHLQSRGRNEKLRDFDIRENEEEDLSKSGAGNGRNNASSSSPPTTSTTNTLILDRTSIKNKKKKKKQTVNHTKSSKKVCSIPRSSSSSSGKGVTKKKKLIYTTVQPNFIGEKQQQQQQQKQLKKSGSGIQYLPSDVRSLRKQLTYLMAEYKSGNYSLRNQIASILKNLHERNVMTKDEYRIQLNSVYR